MTWNPNGFAAANPPAPLDLSRRRFRANGRRRSRSAARSTVSLLMAFDRSPRRRRSARLVSTQNFGWMLVNLDESSPTTFRGNL